MKSTYWGKTLGRFTSGMIVTLLIIVMALPLTSQTTSAKTSSIIKRPYGTTSAGR